MHSSKVVPTTPNPPTYIHTNIHTYIHTNINTYTHTYIHIYIHTYRQRQAKKHAMMKLQKSQQLKQSPFWSMWDDGRPLYVTEELREGDEGEFPQAR